MDIRIEKCSEKEWKQYKKNMEKLFCRARKLSQKELEKAEKYADAVSNHLEGNYGTSFNDTEL